MSDKSKIEWTDATCRVGGTGVSRRSPNLKVAFSFKQWGGVRRSETGRELDRRTYDEFPECRQTPAPDLEFRRNAMERLELFE